MNDQVQSPIAVIAIGLLDKYSNIVLSAKSVSYQAIADRTKKHSAPILSIQQMPYPPGANALLLRLSSPSL